MTTDLKNSFSDEFPPALLARMSRRGVAAALYWIDDQIGHRGSLIGSGRSRTGALDTLFGCSRQASL